MLTLTNTFAADVLDGLNRPPSLPKQLQPKYFYDALGSTLFERICCLPEYYPTRTELQILADNACEIARAIGPYADILEFGAGSLTKVGHILEGLQAIGRPLSYTPIDISGKHLFRAARALMATYPDLEICPRVEDYMAIEKLPKPSQHPIGLFFGSTIGNLEPRESVALLRRAATLLRGGGLLIGVDLVKRPDLLHAAYNDQEGLTAQFNINLLRRINRELKGTFDLNAFSHYAYYNPARQRIEMHLVSREDQVAEVCSTSIELREGETIHTESSHKFTVAGFQELAADSGFNPKKVWIDRAQLFSLHWLETAV
ncbi:dimethylhistidine N-methyltransferase [Cupriavidus sp. YR651]|uniref:L-histidine N(alpha)-methyltransferase n=1 Tax=Cupriavidus sp. YR651 TaxID=1855315 RepID=UPI0008824F4E|nr:L-histidine N(alpha)-methyltransferase [Cupriavidus sp. YR651]SDE02306.1 dimethylhistidine N-methyltransferase [Cupriavidus sp. YR651]